MSGNYFNFIAEVHFHYKTNKEPHREALFTNVDTKIQNDSM